MTASSVESVVIVRFLCYNIDNKNK